MLSLIGTYKDGYVSFEQTLSVVKPVKVIITFLEDIETSDEIFLQLSDFSFQEARQVLKNYTGSFADTIINERRKEL
ncbi:MAG: hypothetical protein IPN94_04710 [Sphingobacteriales bacterium]|jgi:hypothetical protein|nr:hypothetical protein [Sphingobacteriales bacterium]